MNKDLSETEINALTYKARVPAIAMLGTPQATDAGTPGCWFGGEPTLPAEYEWPFFTYPYEPFEGLTVPMHFLAQINLQYVPRVLGLPPLPHKGTLFVFFDPVLSPIWPNHPKDFRRLDKAARVIFHPGSLEDVPRRKAPPMPEIPEEAAQQSGHYGDGVYPYRPIDLVAYESYPGSEEFLNSVGIKRVVALKEAQQQALRTAQGWYPLSGNRGASESRELVDPVHSIFGASQDEHPQTVERVEAGEINDPYPITPDEVLLFRFGADGQIGHYYGHGEYATEYWIKRQDLEQENFDKIIRREDSY